MKTCPNCGKANAPTAKFCGGCGTSLENVPNVEHVAPAIQRPVASYSPSPEPAFKCGSMTPDMRAMLQIALVAIFVSGIGKILFVIARLVHFGAAMPLFTEIVEWGSLVGFSFGCVLKSKLAARICAVIPLCVPVLDMLHFLFFVVEFEDFPFLRYFLDVATHFLLLAGLALFAWVVTPHLIAILNSRRNTTRM